MTGHIRFYNIVTDGTTKSFVIDPVANVINPTTVRGVKIVHASKLKNGKMKYTLMITFEGTTGLNKTMKLEFQRVTVDLTTDEPLDIATSLALPVDSMAVTHIVSKNTKEVIIDIIIADYASNGTS